MELKRPLIELLDRPDQRALFLEEAADVPFVLQLHGAPVRHFDFRIVVWDAAVSWELPMGPTFDPSCEAKAVRVQDRTKGSIKVEGRIGPGRDGDGAILIVDEGWCRPRVVSSSNEESICEGLRSGLLHLTLFGQKMRGGWTLRAAGEGWLLRKDPDSFANSAPDLRRSIRTGRRLHEI
jgi:bifunctional non-homologous end joining protein LigD